MSVKKYMAMVAELPCICCGVHGVELHHPREGQGGAQKAGDYLVIPLCPQCHRSSIGIHGDKTMMRIKKLTEMDMLNETIKQIMRQFL